ncbi:hypothetical protein PENFLA_c070G10915 [Penicillium flavigenum]|uniref:WSC domain-containing protein n=1 Tax=Penicillium flavigenum TaxID=254877 RepID=A0A1V6SD03_9EURO|nr:hypothetical protein PENFLA_c070G10915 [Penicillium flavigenum]
MQLVSILAVLVLAQGTLAGLCKEGQRYCGSSFKHFDNAGDFRLDDNALYVCETFDGTQDGTNGRQQTFRNQPVPVQTCPKTCHVPGGGKDDYCTGEALFDNNKTNDDLANCAEHYYKRTARFAAKTTSKLELLDLENDLYRRLLGCAYSIAKPKTIGNSDKAYNKQVDELIQSLQEGQKKAKAAFDAEKAKEEKAGENN